ncbi:MAG TPA: LysR family transcriptional regulator [Phenylobacterium sp.]|uniref:LysR family transcriptional regulator n=1 Tax=Phenylobacterium sp. NIBR 498073 TaxID=3015177 RepID=UPI0022B2D195|nr:LysR family transcriptional regulator [Phenylobacterium sp. NIBR 498073]WGU41580.1 LysR family transcriptional regulator [Phenylobacterium sp. NIBR 498073]HVK41040.1 LysR family transcriptional regulator [Phenylobacterium sp.]
MLDLEDIQAFAEVAEAQSFGRAGQRLGLSKSMVSRRVARLEAELGAQLLSRTTRGVSVTEAGLEFKERADRVLAELEAARDDLAQRGEEIVGSLRLSAPLSFGMTHLSAVLAELAVRHPKLQVEVSYSDRYVDLIGERYDAAVRIGVLEDSSLVARKIAPIRAAAIASPAFLEAHGVPTRPEDLDHLPAVMSGSEVWRFQDGKRTITVRPEGRFKADNGPAILAAAAAGLGVAMLPTFLVGPSIDKGEVLPLLLDFPAPPLGLYVVRPPPAAHMPAKVRALTDLMLEKFGGEPFWDACYARRAAAGLPA